MNITLTGSLGNISRPLAERLIREGHQLTIISSSPHKAEAIGQLGAKPAIGDLSDVGFLTQTLKGADAVFAMIPTDMTSADMDSDILKIGWAYDAAIRIAQVKHVVLLSSIGADQAADTGPVKALHQVEHFFQKMEDVTVTILRAGFFYYNYYRDIPLIRSMGIMGGNYPGDAVLPLVHPRDIADSIAESLTGSGNGKEVKYIVSDIYISGEIASLLGASIDKENLQWTVFTDQQVHDAITNAGLSKSVADGYTEMGSAIGSGLMSADFFASGAPVNGNRKFTEFVAEFSKTYNAS
ncbi:NAD(P)H-binding protein [Sphingobacterium multivorum]|uniref:NAD(P)H-binding protein n=1 Tax=Sphingobacterium multivorum TaxID=28454 RepID=UPI00345EF42A